MQQKYFLFEKFLLEINFIYFNYFSLYNVTLSVVCQSKASFSRDGQMMIMTATTKKTKMKSKIATMMKTKTTKDTVTTVTNNNNKEHTHKLTTAK